MTHFAAFSSSFQTREGPSAPTGRAGSRWFLYFTSVWRRGLSTAAGLTPPGLAPSPDATGGAGRASCLATFRRRFNANETAQGRRARRQRAAQARALARTPGHSLGPPGRRPCVTGTLGAGARHVLEADAAEGTQTLLLPFSQSNPLGHKEGYAEGPGTDGLGFPPLTRQCVHRFLKGFRDPQAWTFAGAQTLRREFFLPNSVSHLQAALPLP